MRTTFIEELAKLARVNKRIFLVVADLGYSVVESFASEFPDRFLNAGVAEQNMTGLAAGLASEGYHVFTYSIANFPTFRCAEQIRNDIAYHELPVTVVSVGGGHAYGSLGYSHHAVQDLALMRTFPGLLIAAPGDPMETQACLDYLNSHPQPSYLRLGKAGEPRVHQDAVQVEPGIPIFSKSGADDCSNLVLTTAASLGFAVTAMQDLDAQDWAVASLPLWSSRFGMRIRESLRQFKKIVTVEDHLYAGGFGSFIRETLQGETAKDIYSLAIDERACGMVATQHVLNEQGGLTKQGLLDLIA